jgi:hypothetical protein
MREPLYARILGKLGERGTAIVITSVIILGYTALHFDMVAYKDVRILVIKPAPFKKPQKFARQTGYSLGTYRLETEYGVITIKPLCAVDYNSLRLLACVDIEEIEKGRAVQDLSVLGHRISKNCQIFFDRSWIDSINFKDPEELDIGGYVFKVYHMSFREDYFTKEGRAEAVILSAGPFTGDILLSDGARIGFPRRRDFELAIREDSTWTMHAAGNEDKPYSISVTMPGEAEAVEYRSIRFKENWGEFMEGLADYASRMGSLMENGTG